MMPPTRMEFLPAYRVKDGSEYNHVLLTAPFGRYNIPETAIEDLNRLIADCWERSIDFGICECHEDGAAEPLYFDLDFTMEEEVAVDDSVISAFVEIVSGQVLKDIVEAPAAYIFRKPVPVEKKGTKWHVGVHVMYPGFRMSTHDRQAVYREVVKAVRDAGLFDAVPGLKDRRPGEIIDERVVSKNSILKYGCNKPNGCRYELQRVVGESAVAGMSVAEMSAFLSIRRRDTPVVLFYSEAADSPPVTTTRREEPPRSRPLDPERIERVRRLLGLLSRSRSDGYDKWIQVSLCLHNINNSEDMFDLWTSWSSAGCPEKAARTDFRRLWNSFRYREQGLKMGSLALWAKEDSPVEFHRFKVEEIDRRLKRTIDGRTSFDIAKVLYEMYEGLYVCSDIKAHTWYEFRKHSYVEIQEAYTLFINISEELVHEYHQKCAHLYNEMAAALTQQDDEKKRELNKQLELVEKLVQQLKSASFKQTVMTDARMLFYDENFDKKLNESRHLLVFRNGVYDLDARVFRPGYPEDYMSFTTGINYREYDPEDEKVRRVESVIRAMHPEEENYEFLMSVLASGLHGIKREQKLDFWTGTGSNGKSVMLDFLSKSLGDYYDSPPILMLTRRRGSSANASPDLFKLKGKRIVSFSEPEFDDTLHMSIVKQLFGNDWIEARPLFKNPIKFKPQATGLLACNDLPNIPSTDGGTWRRIRALKFKYKFTHNPSGPFERKCDPHLPEQIDTLAEAFISILIHHWCLLQTEKGGIISEPTEVKAFTTQYQKDSNIFLEFIRSNVREEPGAKVTIDQLFERFRFWCRTNVSYLKPSKPELRKQLVQHLGEYKKGGWPGRRLINFDEEEQDDEEEQASTPPTRPSPGTSR